MVDSQPDLQCLVVLVALSRNSGNDPQCLIVVFHLAQRLCLGNQFVSLTVVVGDDLLFAFVHKLFHLRRVELELLECVQVALRLRFAQPLYRSAGGCENDLVVVVGNVERNLHRLADLGRRTCDDVLVQRQRTGGDKELSKVIHRGNAVLREQRVQFVLNELFGGDRSGFDGLLNQYTQRQGVLRRSCILCLHAQRKACKQCYNQ